MDDGCMPEHFNRVVKVLLSHWLSQCSLAPSPAAAIKASSDAAAREQLEKVVEVLVAERCSSFEDCIGWARRKFQVSGRFSVCR